MDKFKKFRDLLQARREELLARHQRLQADMRRQPADENSSYEEQGAKGEFDDVIDSLSELDVRELQQIDDALVRIDNGRYGECTRCGAAISNDRLEAMPETPYCASCAGGGSRPAETGG